MHGEPTTCIYTYLYTPLEKRMYRYFFSQGMCKIPMRRHAFTCTYIERELAELYTTNTCMSVCNIVLRRMPSIVS